MTFALPHDDLSSIRELVDALVAALDAELRSEDAAGVERLALGVQGPFGWPEAPPELVRELPLALARRGDELAADVLVAIERFAPEPLAGLAAEQRDRLERAGVRARHAAAVGTLTLAEAWTHPAPDGEAEIWRVRLRRPGEDASSSQLIVFVGHQPCGAVIEGALLGEPWREEAFEQRVREAGGGAPDALEGAALLRRLHAALDHMERHEVPLGGDDAAILGLLERALTGQAGRLPRPPAAPPEDDEEVEEAELHEAADALTDAFVVALEADDGATELVREEGPFIAHCMLDWKIGYGDRELTRWTLGDLRELMLDWFPRKVSTDEATVAVGAEAIARFLAFLDAEGLLDAPVPLASLEAAVERLRPRFEAACRDAGRWGVAKSMTAGMAGDGVDLADPTAVEDWIADFNARPFGERDAVLGPSLARAPAAPARKRAKRKAARQARRRNRR